MGSCDPSDTWLLKSEDHIICKCIWKPGWAVCVRQSSVRLVGRLVAQSVQHMAHTSSHTSYATYATDAIAILEANARCAKYCIKHFQTDTEMKSQIGLGMLRKYRGCKCIMFICLKTIPIVFFASFSQIFIMLASACKLIYGMRIWYKASISSLLDLVLITLSVLSPSGNTSLLQSWIWEISLLTLLPDFTVKD